MSWKLPFLGAVGSIEEQDIRIPPLSAGCCFSDEYEVPVIPHSPIFPQASTRAVTHYVQSQHGRFVDLAMALALPNLLQDVPLRE